MLTPLNGIQEIDGVVKAPQTWIGKSTDAKPADPANGGQGRDTGFCVSAESLEF